MEDHLFLKGFCLHQTNFLLWKAFDVTIDAFSYPHEISLEAVCISHIWWTGSRLMGG